MKGMILAMEIFTLLDELEDILDRSRNLPFSAKTVVNKEEILDLLKEIFKSFCFKQEHIEVLKFSSVTNPVSLQSLHS